MSIPILLDHFEFFSKQQLHNPNIYLLSRFETAEAFMAASKVHDV